MFWRTVHTDMNTPHFTLLNGVLKKLANMVNVRLCVFYCNLKKKQVNQGMSNEQHKINFLKNLIYRNNRKNEVFRNKFNRRSASSAH